MVNCKNCGAPLSLKDAYCPHCGTPNPEAQEHLRKLRALDREFQNAKSEVRSEVQKSRKGYGVLVILVIVLLANLSLIPLHMASYEIADRIRISRMKDSEIRTKMDALLEAGEFSELFLFVNHYNLSYTDYGPYCRIGYLASDYVSFLENVTSFRYDPEPYTDPLVKACQNIIDFKTEYRSVLRWEEDETFRVYTEALNRDFDAAAREYLKLTDEDLQDAENMTGSALLVRVNERMHDEDR